MLNDCITPFERILQISAGMSYLDAKRTRGFNKLLFKSALKADAKRLAASFKKERIQVELAVA